MKVSEHYDLLTGDLVAVRLKNFIFVLPSNERPSDEEVSSAWEMETLLRERAVFILDRPSQKVWKSRY